MDAGGEETAEVGEAVVGALTVGGGAGGTDDAEPTLEDAVDKEATYGGEEGGCQATDKLERGGLGGLGRWGGAFGVL